MGAVVFDESLFNLPADVKSAVGAELADGGRSTA